MTIKLNKAIVLDVTIISQSERSKQITCVKPDLQPRFRTRHFVLNKVKNKIIWFVDIKAATRVEL